MRQANKERNSPVKQGRPAPRVTVEDHLSGTGDSGRILDGLTSEKKHISSMYFYDEIGAVLFREITELPEYYLARTEKGLLKRAASDLGRKLKNSEIVEIGSGDESKISIFLERVPHHRMSSLRYIPVDICIPALRESARCLAARFPGLRINCVAADFTSQMQMIPEPEGRRRIFCFFGSTLGNLSREQSAEYFRALGEVMCPGDELLLGVDMVKEQGILERAYNDSRSVTAAFNRNILSAANRLAGTDFRPELFRHIAFYNERRSRVEMHLEALSDMEISTPMLTDKITIERGERIHTENSYKFTVEHIAALASEGGMGIKKTISDENNWYLLAYLVKK